MYDDTTSEPTIGVMGGFSPQAAVAFLSQLQEKTPIRAERDHLHVVADIDPKVPDINAAVGGTGPDAGPALCVMAQRLEAAGADFLVLVCNAAHWYQARIEAAVGIPFLSMPEAVVASLAAGRYGRIASCAILATDGGLRSQVYQRALATAGINAIEPAPAVVERMMRVTDAFNSGRPLNDGTDEIHAIITALAAEGAQAVIAACTEIPLIVSTAGAPLPIIDPSAALVEAVIEHALSRRSPAGTIVPQQDIHR